MFGGPAYDFGQNPLISDPSHYLFPKTRSAHRPCGDTSLYLGDPASLKRTVTPALTWTCPGWTGVAAAAEAAKRRSTG